MKNSIYPGCFTVYLQKEVHEENTKIVEYNIDNLSKYYIQTRS